MLFLLLLFFPDYKLYLAAWTVFVLPATCCQPPHQMVSEHIVEQYILQISHSGSEQYDGMLLEPASINTNNNFTACPTPQFHDVQMESRTHLFLLTFQFCHTTIMTVIVLIYITNRRELWVSHPIPFF